MTNEEIMIVSIIDWTIANAAERSKDKFSGVHYVENDDWPEGVYRISVFDLIPRVLNTPTMIASITEVVDRYDGKIEWDRESNWFTIYSR